MLVSWCKKMEQVSWQQEKPVLEYEAVKKAVSDFMTFMQGGSRILVSYDKRTEELVYSDGEELLPIRLAVKLRFSESSWHGF